MADNLIFPIKFDLEKAVEQAGKDWDGKFADRLEKLMAKRPVNVKLNLDVKNLDSLDAVRKRLAELKLEPITPETRNAIRSLTQELKTLEKILERIQRLNAGRESTRAYINEQRLLAYKEKTHQAEERAKKAAELTEQAKKRTEILQQKLEQQVIRTAAAEQRLANSQKNGVSNIRSASTAYAEQTTYLQRLVQRMAAYYSVRQIGNFLTKVRDVTAQFELQRVSLGAIIQDQQRANALFSEIKSFALKSPVSIMDLTKYTKQLAAYKIGVDELFETTKKLTDVSVGLGVSMDRVVLAYGQVRSRGALYSSEIRQFTEMGVPIVEELAAKLTKMNGELVTAKDVLKQVEKGAISFELVKEVFDDMTSAGGMFYNMQEKQGNTLFGMWAKLGDAASVMYDEIGNTESVNKYLKDTIQLFTDIMKNWRTVASELKTLGIGFAVFKAATVIIKAMQVNTIAAAAATRSMTRASIAHRTAVAAGNPVMKSYTTMLRQVAVWNRKAALSTNLFTVAANKLKVALVSWGPMAIVAGLGMLITYLVSAAEKAGRLKRELNGIAGETGIEISRMVTNFESLAKKAVEAADGSREQKDALSELQRTYRGIIPEQNLTIEKLREMKGEYSNLTIAIREYIREQQLQKGLSAISENYGKKLIDAEKEFRDKLEETKIEAKDGAGFYLSEQQIDRIVGYYKVLVREGKSAQEALQETFRVEGINHLVDNYTKLVDKLGLIKRAGNDIQAASTGAGGAVTYFEESVTGLTKVIQDEEKSIADFKKQMDGTIPTLGRLADYIDKAKKKISEHNFVSAENTFAYNQETAKVQVNAYIEALEEAINSTDVGIDFSKYIGRVSEATMKEWRRNHIDLSEFITIDPNGVKRLDFTGLNKALLELNSEWKAQLQGLTEEVQNVYDGFIPSEATTRSVREKFTELATSMGVLDKVKSKMIGASESLEDYRKKINDTYKDYAKQVENLTKVLAITPIVSTDYLDIEAKLKDVKEREEFFKKFAEMLGLDKTGTSQSDPRLGILNEMASTLKQINKEYDDLLKKEGATKALADTQKIYADTFKNMQALAEQYKFDLPDFGVPTDTATLTQYLGAIKDAMAKLSKTDKAVLSLQVDIDKLDIDAKQKQIEEELKRLAEQVSRTKAAQEFYNKILGATGDIDLAANVTMSIYGETGTGLFDAIVSQIRNTFQSGDIEVDAEIGVALNGVIDVDNERINYGELAKIYEQYQDKIIEKNRSTAETIIKDGQKRAAENVSLWEKELAKAKDYEEQRTDIIKRETQYRADIIKSNLPQEEKDRLAAQSQRRQDEGLAKLNFEEFTKSEDYIRIFENLDNVATVSLKRLREEMQSLIDTNHDLSPENMKTLVKAMENIDEQIGERNPFEALVSSAKEYIDSIKNIKIAKQELAAAEAEYKTQEPHLTADVNTAKAQKETADANVMLAEQNLLSIQQQMAELRAQEIVDKTTLASLREQEIAAENKLVSAKLQQNQAEANVTMAVQKQAQAQNKVNKAQNKVNKATDNAKKSQSKFLKSTNNVKKTIDGVQTAMEALSPILGDLTKEGTAFGDAWATVTTMIGTFQSLMSVVITLQEAFNVVTAANPWLAIAAAVLAVISALSFGIGQAKVRRAEKIIKTQERLVDDLKFAYDRLEKSIEKAFGADYLQKYNQKLSILRAQQEAYLKMANAELSKGKKADKDKYQEYLNSARDISAQIQDIENDLVSNLVGTDIGSAAKDFADAWLDAYLSFDDTAGAIEEKFNDMMKNLIVHQALAGVVQRVLEPFFKQIDDAAKDNELSSEELANIMSKLPGYISMIDDGLSVSMEALKQAGFDLESLRDTTSGLTGISRDIASASEESINGLAAGINTQNFYISQIHANVVMIAQYMLSGNRVSHTGGMSMQELVTMQNTYLSTLPAIEANTAATVARCERAAIACENLSNQLSKVIRPTGTKAAYSVSTTLN